MLFFNFVLCTFFNFMELGSAFFQKDGSATNLPSSVDPDPHTYIYMGTFFCVYIGSDPGTFPNFDNTDPDI